MGKVVQWVAAGGRRLAGQVVVSIVATAAAAFIVPPLVDRAAPGLFFSAREKPVAVQVVAPEYFEAAFLWPAIAQANIIDRRHKSPAFGLGFFCASLTKTVFLIKEV